MPSEVDKRPADAKRRPSDLSGGPLTVIGGPPKLSEGPIKLVLYHIITKLQPERLYVYLPLLLYTTTAARRAPCLAPPARQHKYSATLMKRKHPYMRGWSFQYTSWGGCPINLVLIHQLYALPHPVLEDFEVL